MPWWFKASFAEDAPHNDLSLFKSIQNFDNEAISKSALKALANHTWYLTKELNLFSLFS